MIKKIRNIYLNFKDYFTSHQSQLLLILILFILSNYIEQIPYLNKILTFWVRAGVLWMISILILKLTLRVSMIIAIILTTITLLALILKIKEIPELFGNIIYFLLLIIFWQSFWQYLKEIKANPK